MRVLREGGTRITLDAIVYKIVVHNRIRKRTPPFAATFDGPHRLSAAVRHVLVNGAAVVRVGEHTGAKPGRIVRGPGYRGN